MDVERRRLEELAFGRGTAAGERDTALERLHEIDITAREEADRQAEALDAEQEQPPQEPARRGRVLLIAAAAIVVVATATVVIALQPPEKSITVFDHVQSTQDRADATLLQAPEATSKTVRSLASGDNWLAFGLRGTRHEVCLGLISAGALSLKCTSPADFAEHGVKISADFADAQAALVTGHFSWGPRGSLKSTIIRDH